MRLLIAVIIMNLLVLPSAALGQDYPAGYLGPGYRDYINNRIRDGYHINIFTALENRQKEQIYRRNMIEEVISHSYQANIDSANEIFKSYNLRAENTQMITQTVAQDITRTKQVAAAQTGFKFVTHSDGKTIYFQDGLPSSIINERVVDEFGNVSLRNTWNMQYNDRRLLTGYEASSTDELGNVSHMSAYGIKYSADSVFYGGQGVSANKNEVERYTKEVDSAGNVRLTHWQALSYDGKLLRAFHQETEDSVYGASSFTRQNISYEDGNYRRVNSYAEEGIGTDGLEYSLKRDNITYNHKHLVAGYQEERVTTEYDGGKIYTSIDAQFKYLDVPHQFGLDVEEPDPDKLLESIFTTTTKNPDGSERSETTTTSYNYDANQQLIGASGSSVFTGQIQDWWDYKDTQGHILARTEDELGDVLYVYIDPLTQEKTIVPEDEVIKTLKNGDKYSGISQIQFEIAFGKPMTSQVDSITSFYHSQSLDLLRTEESTLTFNNGLVNNLRRALDSHEHKKTTSSAFVDIDGNPQKHVKDIDTIYIYAANGNLIDAFGEGQGWGYELTQEKGWMNYDSTVSVDYEVILGKEKQKKFEETKNYDR